jgi:Protein of unknown function (DUF3089)
MPRAWKLAVAAVLVALLAACGGTARKPDSADGSTDRWGVVWLCRPGVSDDPCTSDLTTTVVQPDGARRVERLSPSANAPVDCFYVYPTVSGQPTVNASRAIDLRLRTVAVAQAARFSQACRVYAPVYRQITLAALEHPRRITLANALVAYDSVLRAFRDYLLHYNNGRGIVLIGHSQGAAILDRLIAREVDRVPSVRRRLVSALLLGGNVTSRDFAHIPVCASRSEWGCVVAYSSFTSAPSAKSQFGRTTSDAGVRLLARPRAPNARIVCVDPAAPAGGTALLHPAVPSIVLTFLGGRQQPSISTSWVSFPGWYESRCASARDASWLQVTPVRPAMAPALTRLEDPAIGLHVLDVNIALDDLVRLARAEAASYVRRTARR